MFITDITTEMSAEILILNIVNPFKNCTHKKPKKPWMDLSRESLCVSTATQPLWCLFHVILITFYKVLATSSSSA